MPTQSPGVDYLGVSKDTKRIPQMGHLISWNIRMKVHKVHNFSDIFWSLLAFWVEALWIFDAFDVALLEEFFLGSLKMKGQVQ